MYDSMTYIYICIGVVDLGSMSAYIPYMECLGPRVEGQEHLGTTESRDLAS